MQALATFVSGVVFGLGLCVSGLVNPSKVQAFLDVTGQWDPSLAVTMATAVLTTGLGYRLVFARGTPIFATKFQIPAAGTVDPYLLAGAAIFGVGWGLVGFCPGPALAALSLGTPPAFIFVSAMLAGMAIARFTTLHRATSAVKLATPAQS